MEKNIRIANDGVHHRNLDLNELNDKLKLALSYAEAVLSTAHQPFLVLDGNLNILRANPAFYKAFKTTPETTEGRLLYDLGDKQWDIPELREFLQALLLQDTSFKDCEITHAFPDVGMKTMRLNGTPLVGGDQIQILLAIEDVSDYRTALNALKELNDKSKLALNYAEAVLNTAHQPFLVLDIDLRILRANPAFYKAFKTTPETTEGRLLYDLGDRQWDIPELRQFLQALLLQDTSFKDCEITHVFPDVGKKTMRLNGTPLVGGEQLQILLAIEDVSDYRTAINYAETTIKTVTQPFLVLDGDLNILRANPAFYKAFKTTPDTTEGRLLYDLGDRQWDIPELRQFLQALLLQDTSFKDCEITHVFPDVGKKTMRLNGTPLVGGEQLQILLAIEDVSDYRTAINYAETTIKTVTQPFLVLDGDLNILRANPAFYKAFKTTPDTTEGRLLYDLGDRQWDIPELREFLQALLLQDTSFKDCEITHVFPDVGKKTMRLNGTPLVGGDQIQILLAIEDVSDYRTALNTLKELNDKSKLALNYAEAVVNTAHQPFLVLDIDLRILRANPAFYKAFKTTTETTEGRLLYDLGDRQWDIP